MLLLDVLGEGLDPWYVPRRRQFERNGVRGCRWVHPPCAARRPHSLVTASHPQSCAPRATTTGSPCRGSQANRGGGTRNGSYVPALGVGVATHLAADCSQAMRLLLHFLFNPR